MFIILEHILQHPLESFFLSTEKNLNPVQAMNCQITWCSTGLRPKDGAKANPTPRHGDKKRKKEHGDDVFPVGRAATGSCYPGNKTVVQTVGRRSPRLPKPSGPRDPARTRAKALASPRNTPTWQRCRFWTSPCWTTRARSETRFSSRSPSSAWKTCRRVSEWVSGYRFVVGTRALSRDEALCADPRSRFGTRRPEPTPNCGPKTVFLRGDWEKKKKIGAGAFVPVVPPTIPASIGWLTFDGALCSTLIGQSRPPSNCDEEFVQCFAAKCGPDNSSAAAPAALCSELRPPVPPESLER